MRQCAAVDVFEFAANGYSVCNARHLEAPSQCQLAEIVRRRLAFHGWIGGQDHFANFAKPEQMLEGVHATLRQLVSALERNKVAEINPSAGTKFDPHQHQAISVVPAPQEPNTVVAVLQKGYLIADRVLRPALVTVAAAA